ncbi:S-methyl-5-thioribose-1-phosphate isomerase [Immundisolibacter cernigliae]|uniref:Methylthioribose-1-phosphate isomerase n=1 Tax=Immundisolibacter cernigliae TaxID=1810504 RepID=A0A1B1YW16_9GAMM|nr:S-methyl-5-thioribose-1-phosphate isomerase [Immundisolibacter cernigliae]ANX04956.1 S-methyl-5-thioribose-1-phosphate isomerase [Immundisolibacter cernigliae]
MSAVCALRWQGGALELLDQRLLPAQQLWLRCASAAEVADAIRDMVVRGAPAIGIAAAYGAVLAARAAYAGHGTGWRDVIVADLDLIAAARPTAVNLAWAVQRMAGCLAELAGDPEPALLAAARAIHDQDIAANHAMAAYGAALIEPGSRVLTHCNTGALATGGHGTALGVIRTAHAQGRIREVFVDETRPWLQGARLTAWELQQDGIPARLVVDGAAAWLFARLRPAWLIVGADRIAANGDTANKIGTYTAALAARAHGARVMVVAPLSTFDPATPDGSAIEVEERPAQELTCLAGQAIAPAGFAAWNPVFDVTPADLIDAIVCEHGVIERPDAARIADFLAALGP